MSGECKIANEIKEIKEILVDLIKKHLKTNRKVYKIDNNFKNAKESLDLLSTLSKNTDVDFVISIFQDLRDTVGQLSNDIKML
jgi:DNA anti-recombination protein RmuC